MNQIWGGLADAGPPEEGKEKGPMAKKNKEELQASIMEMEMEAGLDVSSTAGWSKPQLVERYRELNDSPGAAGPVTASGGGSGTSDTQTEPRPAPGEEEGSQDSTEKDTTAPNSAPAEGAALHPQQDPENPQDFQHVLFLKQYNCMEYSIRPGRIRAADALGRWVPDIITNGFGAWIDREKPDQLPAGCQIERDPTAARRAAEQAEQKVAERPVGRFE